MKVPILVLETVEDELDSEEEKEMWKAKKLMRS